MKYIQDTIMSSDSIGRIDDLADVLLILLNRIRILEDAIDDMREKLNETDERKRF